MVDHGGLCKGFLKCNSHHFAPVLESGEMQKMSSVPPVWEIQPFPDLKNFVCCCRFQDSSGSAKLPFLDTFKRPHLESESSNSNSWPFELLD